MGNLSQFFITLGKENRRNAKRQFLNVEGNGGGIQKEEMMDDKTKVKQENERFMELKEMNGKYTCFGKVYGHDLYNLLHLSDSMASSTTLSSATLSSLHTNLQSLDINRNLMVTIDKIEVVKWGTYFTEKNLIVPRPLAQVDHQLTYSQLRQALQMRLQKEKENNPNIHYDNISLIGNETKHNEKGKKNFIAQQRKGKYHLFVTMMMKAMMMRMRMIRKTMIVIMVGGKSTVSVNQKKRRQRKKRKGRKNQKVTIKKKKMKMNMKKVDGKKKIKMRRRKIKVKWKMGRK